MFRQLLQEVVDGAEGGVAGLLMGYDGIAVDQYTRVDTPFDVESVGMEYTVPLKSIMTAVEMLQAGSASEISVRSDRLITLIRPINSEYFTAITLQPNGNLGKARYLLRVRAPKLAEAL